LQTKSETPKNKAVFHQQPGQTAVKTTPTWPYLNVNYAPSHPEVSLIYVECMV